MQFDAMVASWPASVPDCNLGNQICFHCHRMYFVVGLTGRNLSRQDHPGHSPCSKGTVSLLNHCQAPEKHHLLVSASESASKNSMDALPQEPQMSFFLFFLGGKYPT